MVLASTRRLPWTTIALAACAKAGLLKAIVPTAPPVRLPPINAAASPAPFNTRNTNFMRTAPLTVFYPLDSSAAWFGACRGFFVARKRRKSPRPYSVFERCRIATLTTP
jgi:hypothetical protein